MAEAAYGTPAHRGGQAWCDIHIAFGDSLRILHEINTKTCWARPLVVKCPLTWGRGMLGSAFSNVYVYGAYRDRGRGMLHYADLGPNFADLVLVATDRLEAQKRPFCRPQLNVNRRAEP